MSATTADMTDAEVRALTARLRVRDRAIDGLPPDRPRGDGARPRPLGLAIIDGPEDDGPAEGFHPDSPRPPTKGERQANEIVASSVAMLSAEALAAPITWRHAFEDILATAFAGVFDGDDAVHACVVKLREQVAELKAAQRNEIAELKLALTEARCEIREMKMIQENARTLSRGEQGVSGPRGVPGAQGPIGPAGPQGQKGEGASMIVAWEPTPERYWLTPVYSTGDKGVPANLTSLFEQYNRATEADDEES
jgi:hypothetical protein